MIINQSSSMETFTATENDKIYLYDIKPTEESVCGCDNTYKKKGFWLKMIGSSNKIHTKVTILPEQGELYNYFEDREIENIEYADDITNLTNIWMCVEGIDDASFDLYQDECHDLFITSGLVNDLLDTVAYSPFRLLIQTGNEFDRKKMNPLTLKNGFANATFVMNENSLQFSTSCNRNINRRGMLFQFEGKKDGIYIVSTENSDKDTNTQVEIANEDKKKCIKSSSEMKVNGNEYKFKLNEDANVTLLVYTPKQLTHNQLINLLIKTTDDDSGLPTDDNDEESSNNDDSDSNLPYAIIIIIVVIAVLIVIILCIVVLVFIFFKRRRNTGGYTSTFDEGTEMRSD